MGLSLTVGGRYKVDEYAGRLTLAELGNRATIRSAVISASWGILGVATFALLNVIGRVEFLAGVAFVGGLCGLAWTVLSTLRSADNPVCWEVSPGVITRKTMVLGRFRPRDKHFRVEHVEVAHGEWVSGWLRRGAGPNGSTDRLRFWTRETGYIEITSIDFDRQIRTQCLAHA